MPVTGVRGRQILDDSVTRADINVTATGSALITKLLAGAGLSITSSTGVDSGTGDVTLGLGNSGVTAGTYGSSTLVPVITVDQYGRITGVSTSSISSGTGTVTSVGLSLPSIFTVSNSPVTTSGTLTGTLANQNPNLVFAGPSSGVAAAPTFRGLVADDIPSLDTAKLTSGILTVARGGTGAATFSAGAIIYALSATQFAGTLGTAGQFLVSGGSGVPTWVNPSLTSITDSYIKKSVKAATTGQVPLSGLTAVDGVTIVNGDRILVKNNDVANPAFHGIYIASSGVWTRATDNDSLLEMAGAEVAVEQGTVNGGTIWRTNFKTTDTFGTTAINWYRVVDTSYTIPVSQGGTGATTLTGVIIGNGTSAMVGVSGTASQLLRRNAGNTAYEFFTHTFASTTGAVFTGTIQSTLAWNAASGSAQIFLDGATGNRIDFGGAGVAEPSFTTRSVGTKLVLYPEVSASSVDYAIGIQSSTMWFSVPVAGATRFFRWYGGTTNIATLDSAGALTTSGTITSSQANGFTIGGLVNSARIQYGSDAATSFSLLTAANGYAGLYASTGIFSSTITAGGATLNGTLIFANASSPNTHTIQFGDNTGWTLRFMTNVSGTPTQRFAFVDNGTFSAVGQIISTKSNTTADGTGQIFLNGTGGNRIDWNAQGVAAPTYTTRSAGTKLVLYPSVNASQVDYGFGIESDTLWASVAVNGGGFKWYGGTQLNMHLSGQNLVIGTGAGVGAGRLTVNAASGGTSLYLTDAVNSTLYITHNSGGSTRFFNGNAVQWMQEVGTAVTIGNTTSAPSKLYLYNTNDGIPDYQITHQSSGASLNTSSPIIITNTYNNGSNGHNLYVTSNSLTGIWEYNITKTWGGILSFGSSSTGTTIKRDLYIYDSGQIRFANYTSTSSFSGTALGVLAFTADGSIIPIPTPGGGSGITGSGNANYVTKFTGGTTIGNSLIFDNGTNVGISTATPDAKLRVAGTSNGTQSIFGFIDGRGLEIATVLVAGTNEAGSILNARGVGAGTLIFQTDGNERMRVASNGDVGIGTNTIANTASYTTLQINGTVGGLVRFSYGNSFAGHIYGSSAELGINSASVFNLYINSSQKFNATATEVNAYETFYARKLGAQIQLAGGVGTASGIFQSGDSNVFITDWNTALNGILINVNNGILVTRGSAAGGAYIQFQRSGTTTYGYVGNSSGLISTAGFNANTDLAIRSEGNINFATSSTAIAQLNTNGRLTLSTYTATTSHTGTIVGFLAFDGSGNIITTAAPSGSSQWTTSGSNIYYSAGNVGIGSTNSRLDLEVSAPASDWTVLSNDVANGHLLLSHTGGNVMAIGLNTNKGWLQVRDFLGTGGTTYDFYLNPLGGRLIVNSQTSDGVGALQVNGTLSFRTNAATTVPAIRFLPKTSLIGSPAQGDLETDTNGLLYYTFNSLDRGVVQNSHFMCLNSNYTLTSSTTAQRIFNTATNGTMGVEAIAYEFEMLLSVTGFSTGSNGSLNISFTTGGGATISSIRYTAIAVKAPLGTPSTAQITTSSSAGQTTITASNTSSDAHAIVKGIMRFSVAGTIRPTITLSVATAAVVQANSYFKMTPLGSTSTTSIGNIG